MPNEIPRLTILHRLAQPWAVRCQRRRAAGGGLDVRDTPSFLWAREYDRPGTAQQTPLFLLRHITQESDRVAHPVFGSQSLEPGPIVALAADVQRNVGACGTRGGNRTDRKFHSFITLQSAQVQECRAWRARRCRIGSIRLGIHAGMNDDYPLRLDASPNQVFPRALGNGVKSHVLIHPGNRPLRCPHHRRHGNARLGERGGSEEMWHDRDERQPRESRKKERNLVDVLDDHVERRLAERPPHCAAGAQGEAVPTPDARDLDPVHQSLGHAIGPAARDEAHVVPPPQLGDPAEQLVEMDFGATGLRILPIVSVDEQNPHSSPVSRATAPNTPLINLGARDPANQWASFTASSMTTRDGVDASSSSARASRRMLRSTAPTRSSRQCSAASAIRRSNSGSPAMALAARSAPRSYPLGAPP